MTTERESLEKKFLAPIQELERLILSRYPGAQFEIERGHDEPRNVHITTIVDLEDPDEVVDLVIDRVLELQLNEGVPIHVIPIRTPERVDIELLAERRSRGRYEPRKVPLVGR